MSNLSERHGWYVVHQHEEGQACVSSPRTGDVCYYEPTVLTRVFAALAAAGLLMKPQWCRHQRDLIVACATCRARREGRRG